jgi:hypothetical protein
VEWLETSLTPMKAKGKVLLAHVFPSDLSGFFGTG